LMSAALTLMVPYWQVDPTAAFSSAFSLKGAEWAKYAVSLGALSGMTTSLVGGMFALPRCVYAMAEDGLIFKTFATINGKTQVPVHAVVVFGSATAVIALLFDIETLVEFLSIGTLLAYSIVSACVIILRYRPEPLSIETEDVREDRAGRIRAWVPGQQYLAIPLPGSTVTHAVFAMIVGDVGISCILASGQLHTTGGYLLIAVSSFITATSFALICLHEQSTAPRDFKVPLVPFIPALSILVNVLLMLHLAPITWLRLIIWLGIGLAIYLLYGINHSREEETAGLGDLTKSVTYESMVSETSAP